jgi:hypothetical protein
MFSKIVYAFRRITNTKVKSGCGHLTHVKGPIAYFKPSFNGGIKTKNIISLILDKKGEATHCLSCIEDASIRCTWCGGSILPLEPITLYIPCDDDYIAPEYAVIYNPDNTVNRYVGCLRWDCAETGADMCGFWGFDKQVHRVKSPLDVALETEEVVIVKL